MSKWFILFMIFILSIVVVIQSIIIYELRTDVDLNSEKMDVLEESYEIKLDLQEAQFNKTVFEFGLDFEDKIKSINLDKLQKNIDYLQVQISTLDGKIDLMRENNMIAKYPRSEKNSGIYWHDTGVIEIYAGNMPLFVAKDVAMHELAHKYWFEDMNARDRSEYCREFNQATEFVTDYAKTECEEDFAENFMYSARVYLEPIGYERFDKNIEKIEVVLG